MAWSRVRLGATTGVVLLQFVEGNGGVGESIGVDGSAGRMSAFDRIGDVPDVDVHARRDPVLAVEPERDELALVHVAADHDVVVAAGARPMYSIPRSYWSVKK